jgi:PAS domain S-box-containing protein
VPYQRVVTDPGELARILDAVPLLVASCDADCRYTRVNRAYAARFNRTPLDLVGLRMSDIVGPEVFAAIEPLIARVLSGERVEAEMTLSYPALGLQTVRSVLTPVRDGSGAIVGWDGVGEDITEQKRVARALVSGEERLRAALDASETGTFLWDMRTNALDCDDNLRRLLGLAPGASMPSLSEFLRRVHDGDRARVTAACGRCSGDGDDFEEEFRVVWADRTTRWIYGKGRTHRGGDGVPAHMNGACVDVSDRRRKEDALRAADRQKDEFLGMLAHELRNPLAPLVYALAVLDGRATDPEMKRPLEIMQRQVKRLSTLVDDLLDISRVTQGKIALQRDDVDLGAVLHHAVDVVRPALDAAGHAIEVDLADSVTVCGDLQRLGQVFENLLANAVKYTPPGGRIAVQLRRDCGDAVVAVRDNGIGIAPAVLPRVFDLFVQSDASIDRAQGGLGIGLTLVERLTRLHGGSVTAHSRGANQGSEFVVRLPTE